MNYEVGTRLLVQNPKKDTIIELIVVEVSELCIKLQFVTSNYKGDCFWIQKSQNEIAKDSTIVEVIEPKPAY